MTNALYLSLSLLLMAAGGFTYIIFRPETLNLFHWLRCLGIDYGVLRFKGSLLEISPAESFLIFCLPNGLWLLSGLIVIGLLWKNKPKIFLFYSAFAFAVPALSEIGQLLKIVPGTYDALDLLAYGMAFFSGLAIYFLSFHRDGVRADA